MSAAWPKVTVALLQELMADTDRVDPVLYLDVESNTLEVWASAYVPGKRVVVSQAEMVDWFGYPIDAETLGEILPELQEKVESIGL